MSATARVLDRLQRVKQTAPDRWIAACPAHEDHSPSLSIRETGDGRVLVYDFGGCDTAAVLAALGLKLSDLFDEPLAHQLPPSRSRIPARELLELIDFEVTAAMVLLAAVIDKREIGELGWERLCTAARRISTARSHSRG